MSISAISTGSLSVSTQNAVGAVGARRGPPPPSAELLKGQTVDGVELSDPGQLFQQLQELGQSDPDQLKTVLSDIADKLRSIAQGGTAGGAQSGAGGVQGADAADAGTSAGAAGVGDRFLLKLAERFDRAAETGDLSSLVPGGTRPGASRGEAAYAAAGRGGPPPDLFGRSSSESSSTDIQQQIAALRQQIAALTSKATAAA